MYTCYMAYVCYSFICVLYYVATEVYEIPISPFRKIIHLQEMVLEGITIS